MTTELPDWEALRATWPNAGSSRFVEVGAIRWHVQVAGHGPPLLLLHGTGGASHSFGDMVPLLARDHTVIVPDLPGAGFTGALGEPPTIDAMARAVAALCTALEMTPAIAAGHSAGVAILLAVARDRLLPLKAIVGFGSALIAPPNAYRELVAPWLTPLVTSTFASKLGAALGAQPAIADLVLSGASDAIPAAQKARYGALFAASAHVAGAMAMMAHWDVATLLRSLAGVALPPITLVHGTRDAFVPLAGLRTVAATLPTTTVVEWEGAGHLLHEERPEAAVEAVRRVISDTGPGHGAP